MMPIHPNIPPERIWIKVWDLPSALLALNLLLAYIRNQSRPNEQHDVDQV